MSKILALETAVEGTIHIAEALIEFVEKLENGLTAVYGKAPVYLVKHIPELDAFLPERPLEEVLNPEVLPKAGAAESPEAVLPASPEP